MPEACVRVKLAETGAVRLTGLCSIYFDEPYRWYIVGRKMRSRTITCQVVGVFTCVVGLLLIIAALLVKDKEVFGPGLAIFGVLYIVWGAVMYWAAVMRRRSRNEGLFYK